MTVTIGAITLSDNLLLKGLRASTVSVDQQYTIGGTSVVQVGLVSGGRSLSLEGYFTAAQIDSIKALEALGQSVALVHPRATLQVIITGTDVVDWVEYVEQNADDYEMGTITMIEVGT